MCGNELILTDLAEETTKRLAQKQNPQGLKENVKVAKAGGGSAKVARDDIEKKLGESIVVSDNRLNYQYKDEKLLESKNKL